MFRARYPIRDIRPASYNPRSIDAKGLSLLRSSIRRNGLGKPLIVRDNGVVIAGHQRLKAVRSLGRKTAPVYVVTDVTDTDEVRFNQLHNMTEDLPEVDVTVPAACVDALGRFVDVDPDKIDGDTRASGAVIRRTIADLLFRYGPWGAAIATLSGRVVHGSHYALACHVAGIPCRVYRITDKRESISYLNRSYGRFDYGSLPRQTWLQSTCQRPRMKGEDVPGRSRLYERLVLPSLSPGDRVVDFGAGRGEYVDRLRSRGVNAVKIEFFPGSGGGSLAVDTGVAEHWIREALAEWRHGLFDVVVCDSVLNSVDTVQAEADVMTVLNALCRPGGMVYFSGRRRERLDHVLRYTKQSNRHQYYSGFVDQNGFAALYRGELGHGAWTFQKFHRPEDAMALATSFIGSAPIYKAQSSTSWQVAVRKELDLPMERVEQALRREFDLPWPDGRSVGMAADAVQAWRSAVSLCEGIGGTTGTEVGGLGL